MVLKGCKSRQQQNLPDTAIPRNLKTGKQRGKNTQKKCNGGNMGKVMKPDSCLPVTT